MEKDGPKFSIFGPTFPPHHPPLFTPEDSRGKKKISISVEKLQPLGYPNMAKSRLYLLSSFQAKYNHFLEYLGYFCQ